MFPWQRPRPPAPPAQRSRAPLPPGLMRDVRRIEIRTNRLLNTVFLGDYRSVFRGRGIEFSEVREYEPGDDIRSVDWNVTARMGQPFMKQFVEERELTVMLLVDASASGRFGTSQKRKIEVAAEVSALLAFSAVRNNDKVGLMIFTDRIEKFIPPQKGRLHVLRLIRELLAFDPQSTQTDLRVPLSYLMQTIRRRSIVFLISDFHAEDYETSLKIVARHHDIIAIVVRDPREEDLPAIGLVLMEDAENGNRVLVDLGNAGTRQQYLDLVRQERDRRNHLLRSLEIDQIPVWTDRPYVEPILGFFATRSKGGP